MKIYRLFYVTIIFYFGLLTVSTVLVDAACGGVLTRDRGVIRSPSYPNNYPPNTNCTWEIVAPGRALFALNFTDFTVEFRTRKCSADFVEVLGQVSPGGEWTSLGKFCGRRGPWATHFEGSRMRLEFRSDDYVELTGFSADYLFTGGTTTTAFPSITPQTSLNDEVGLAREKLRHWLLGQRKDGAQTSKWGHQLPRTAVALFLADQSGSFQSGNRSMDEINYELAIQLLSKMLGGGPLKRRDLSLYIHALMVTCADPRNFHGRDLVAELRADVDSNNRTNVGPFEMLVLCNAGEAMTNRDVERIAAIFDSQRRPFWTDNQALAVLALACASEQNGNAFKRKILDISRDLKKKQDILSGTVGNLKTTALVLQALLAAGSVDWDFDFGSAVRSLVLAQGEDGSVGSVLDAYYVLPVLANATLLDVARRQCASPNISESEALNELQSFRGSRVSVKYSVVVGMDEDLKRTWTLKVPANSSLYDVMETVQNLDSRQELEFNVIDGKPYVSSAMGIQDDAELGLYWFTYARRSDAEDPVLLEDSPVDVKSESNEEFILWYKSG